ncbi:MAG: EAL domain-containing protein, partial [Clostridia bacterium]|nr:EAL domain-containing protein [Clostridia bacterium]
NVRIGADDYVVSVCSVGDVGASFSGIALYKSTEIYSTGYSTINTLLTLLIVFFMIFIFFALYAIINRRRTNKRILTLNDTDQRLNCDSGSKFQRVAAEIIDQNRSSNFAIVVVDLKHYRYMSDQLGRDVVTKILQYLKMIFSNGLQINETFGYSSGGRFVLLLHYRDADQLISRLSVMSDLARGYSGKLPSSYHIEIYGGIYETRNKFTDDIVKMIDYAMEAKDSGISALNVGAFRFYNEELQKAHIQNEYIEVHMNSALKNKNFVVFYQPKYNIQGDRPDGSEALVRWYNPEQDQYMVPGIFLPLFEANGFIVKLDHYVYEEVCSYMEQAVELGQPLIPVSVNVSRATAAQSDFLDYYISRKRAHRIADGFLTIEFTESFAYENYDALREMTVQLHKNGFKCSIDDFGSGYSSYNILKELPMDEIKLDQFFIHKGLSEERDAAILSSVINVAKALNMKVTQEGVETPDELELLKQLGCDVIQGYHYSKPLFLSDYVDFISRASHSHYRFK